jgi:PAS domain S-box-containing protein
LEEAHRQTVALQTELDHAQRLLAAVDQHAIIMTLSPRGKIATVNDKFSHVFQFSRDELIGADLRLLHPPPYPQDQLADALQAVKDGESWTDVVTAWRGDGQEVRLRVTVSQLEEPATPYIVVASVLPPLKKSF